jgi:hypothetical protein
VWRVHAETFCTGAAWAASGILKGLTNTESGPSDAALCLNSSLCCTNCCSGLCGRTTKGSFVSLTVVASSVLEFNDDNCRRALSSHAVCQNEVGKGRRAVRLWHTHFTAHRIVASAECRVCKQHAEHEIFECCFRLLQMVVLFRQVSSVQTLECGFQAPRQWGCIATEQRLHRVRGNTHVSTRSKSFEPKGASEIEMEIHCGAGGILTRVCSCAPKTRNLVFLPTGKAASQTSMCRPR